MEADEIERIWQSCDRRLTGHRHSAMLPHLVLAELAATVGPEDEADSYGHGKLIAGFEAQVA